ncbi:coiled-coil domain-containing protein [Aminipila sp.]|uniref:coiled-coil domain-containing protein n=1 Tax=Aminipila sp. TaxID=2060095 RepID=UPI002898D48A|nr:hypothetical protein [Aminipila sp.]
MRGLYSWIYVDYTNNIWKFSQNDNKELCYSIMYGEGKWTKESTIDKNILGFAVYVEEDGKIHIIYSNTKGEIKYCTLKDNQWIGKTVYLMDSDEFEIHDLKINIIGSEMHIFYLLVETSDSNRGVLIHSVWDGKEVKDPKLLDIILTPKVKENYIVKVDKMNNIDMLFITDEGEEISLNYSRYKKHRWTVEKRLYSIQGDDIDFDMLNDQQNMHILNKYREGSTYYLEHVHVKVGGAIQEFRICESKMELREPLLFELNNKLYSCWLEENKIAYSVFDGINWSKPINVNKGNDDKVERYHFYIACDKQLAIKEREVYGVGQSGLNLFFPSQFVVKTQKTVKYQANQVEENQDRVKQINVPEKVDALQNLKIQLYRDKSENKQLKKTMASLRIQMQKKQKFIDDYKEKITQLLEQKKKSDENCDVFMELQQKMKNDLEESERQSVEGKKTILSIQNKLNEYKEENRVIKQENTGIKQQIESLIEENNQLKKELEYEKNKSIVERLLKG